MILAYNFTVAEEDDAWQGLDKMMNQDEFTAAGLNKLSKEELEQLDDWFVRFLAHDAQTVVQRDRQIQAIQKAPVIRRIAGRFTGWDGDTIFRLDNGEVWQQRFGGKYRISLENPEVEITRNLLGYYELKIVKTGRRIGVTRIE